jgi:O-antigen/teichoic acid export membrane protein
VSSTNTLRRDIASAYAAAGARIVSWIIISALVYRHDGAGAFAMLALVRATLGLLNYTTIGLAPAMIHFLPHSARQPTPQAGHSLERLYCNGIALAWAAALLGIALLLAYAAWFARSHAGLPNVSPSQLRMLLIAMGIGTILRLASDPASALLQIRGHLALDNTFLAAAELLWIVLALLGSATLGQVGVDFAICGALLLIARSAWGYRLSHVAFPGFDQIQPAILRGLLAFGVVVTLAQAADFLYAPTDYILIDRLLRPIDVATYAPAVQIDGGLLVLVTALASVVLPRAALAHAAGDRPTLKRYYLLGTAASAALLAAASLCVWRLAPSIFRIWLGNPMPATQAILPLVLINTVVGGSSAVGRSILLGAGLVKPFAAAALIAGLTNVLCSIAFVHYAHAGLTGIVLGTSVAVVGRCVIWTPWYVLKSIPRAQKSEFRIPESPNQAQMLK